MMTRGTAPHRRDVKQKETMMGEKPLSSQCSTAKNDGEGGAPRCRVGEWKKMMTRGTAPCHRDVERKETTRGTTLIVAMFNSKKRW
jgi:hypothetical protein